MGYRKKVEEYVSVRLEADLDGLSAAQRRMLPLLIQAAEVMDDLFWRQAYGDKDQLLQDIEDPFARRFAEINYGPWDRLEGNTPFLAGVGPKPAGARFYPEDMAKEEFSAAADKSPGLRSQYSLVRRDQDGSLVAVPYHEAFPEELSRAAGLLREAAGMAEDPGFRNYLKSRAEALVTSKYQASDFAWMDMRDNAIDLVIGPIEPYEDRLFGTKTAFEAYVLIKDKAWSAKLEKYVAMLPALQRGLPVPPEYRTEEPGGRSQLNAYDVLYYAGDCNAGAKTIAINLPNDEQVHLERGSRRLQLKNAMRAKFEHILLPISDILVAEDQRDLIDFDAFFGNIMFHEVAHGLGIKNTLDGERDCARGSCRRLPRPLKRPRPISWGLALDWPLGRSRRTSARVPAKSLCRLHGRHLPLHTVRGLQCARQGQLSDFQTTYSKPEPLSANLRAAPTEWTRRKCRQPSIRCPARSCACRATVPTIGPRPSWPAWGR